MTNSGNSLSTGVKPTYALSFVIALKGKTSADKELTAAGTVSDFPVHRSDIEITFGEGGSRNSLFRCLNDIQATT